MTEEWLRQKIYYCKVNDMLHDAERYECLLSKLLKQNRMKTAVEWLSEKFYANEGIMKSEWLEQAKEMEKEQIVEAYWDGGQDIPLTELRCEQYYNETFKSE